MKTKVLDVGVAARDTVVALSFTSKLSGLAKEASNSDGAVCPVAIYAGVAGCHRSCYKSWGQSGKRYLAMVGINKEWRGDLFICFSPTYFFMQEYREAVGKKGLTAQNPPAAGYGRCEQVFAKSSL